MLLSAIQEDLSFLTEGGKADLGWIFLNTWYFLDSLHHIELWVGAIWNLQYILE